VILLGAQWPETRIPGRDETPAIGPAFVDKSIEDRRRLPHSNRDPL